MVVGMESGPVGPTVRCIHGKRKQSWALHARVYVCVVPGHAVLQCVGILLCGSERWRKERGGKLISGSQQR